MQVQGEDKKSPVAIDAEIEQEKPRRLGLRDRKLRRRLSSSEDLVLPNVIPMTFDKKVEWLSLIQKDELHLIIRVSLAQWNINFETQKLGFICHPVKFDIRIVHTIQNQSLSIQIKLSNKKLKESYIDISGKCSWVQNQLQSKLIKANKKVTHQYNSIFKHKIKESISDVFIDLRFTPLFETSIEFRGLINQGNTCYMNSYLQMLHHLPRLRQIVFALEKCPQGKFPRTLQNLFFKLSKSKSKSVSTEQLSKSYGWSKKDTDVQQDIQQFSCLMLEALQRKVKEQSNKQLEKDLSKLFGGKLIHYVQCLDGVDYVSQNHESFVDLQLNILGTNNLIDSFKSYMAVELLEGDNMYKTQEHGLCRAEKGVAIETLPEVLMIHLKRFEYDLETGVNKKVLTRYEYPDSVDFSPLLSRSIPPYKLYGVLVHESQKANSGHYYSFIKIKNKWYKFNDEVVTEASTREVFQHNFGGTYATNVLDGRQLTISTSQMEVESTAYMLVYYNSALEDDIFGSQDVYPTWLQEEKLQEQNSRSKTSEFIAVSLTDWALIKKSKVSSCGLTTQTDVEEGKDVYVQTTTQLIPNNQNLSQFVFDLAGLNNVDESRISCWIFDMQNNREILVSPYALGPDPTFQEMFKDRSTNILVLFCKQKGLIKVEGTESNQQDQKESESNIVTGGTAVGEKLMVEEVFAPDAAINVIKLYKVDQNGVVTFDFDTYLCSQKESQFQELKGTLVQRYSEANYSLNYFREKKNFDVLPLEDQYSLSIQKARNRMNVIIVQKVHVDAVRSLGLLEHFSRQKNKISIRLRNNDSGEVVERFFPKQMDIVSLRSYINRDLYGCQDNSQSQFVVVKHRPNRNTRLWVEAYNTTIDSITKYDRTIVFQKSIIKASERESCGIYVLAFRSRLFEQSVPVKVVAGKKAKSQFIIDKAMDDQGLRWAFKSEGGKAIRLIMMDSDSTKILRHYKEDYDVWSSWNKLKGNLFIQSAQMDNDDCLYVFIHHKARSGQFIGTPFVLEILKQTTCKQVLYLVLNRCSKMCFQLQQKKYDFNGQKLKVTVYPKQSTLSKGQVIESDWEVSIQSLFPDHLEFCIEVCHLSIASAVQAMRIEC